MKKIAIFTVILFFISTFFMHAEFPDKNLYSEYTLENGMKLFIMEDYSCATVRVEYAVQAGFSSQSADNTGFFELYARLLKRSISEELGTGDLQAECSSDSSSYMINASPFQIERIFQVIAKNAYSAAFSDRLITEELSGLKTEIMQYAYTPAAFINAGIDSKVFSAAPWKQDSGIYPALFAKTTPAQARNTLSRISRFWYTPQNSALFVSGGISKENVLRLAKQSFDLYPRSLNSLKIQGTAAGAKQRKFVIHDSQLSEDLTQIVIQYTSLPFYKTDLLAAALNQNDSTVKKTLCAQKALNIRDPEYIHAAAVHKNGTSRLIIQALLEKNSESPAAQADLFVKKLSEAAALMEEPEYQRAKAVLYKDFQEQTSTSQNLMSFLSKFWSIESLSKNQAQEAESSMLENLLFQSTRILSEPTADISSYLEKEKPFVFILISTKLFNRFKTTITKGGFEQLTQKNSFWYLQALQKNALAQIKEEADSKTSSDFDASKTAADYIEKIRSNTQVITLKNGIEACLTQNKNSTGAVIIISIKGGKLAEGKKAGFQSVMTKSIASNISHELAGYMQQELLESFPKIQTESWNTETHIIISCSTEDAVICAKAAGDAVIFREIIPADADAHVYSIQTEKRLSDASAVNQMYFRGIKYLYDDITIRNIFDSENSILTDTKYTDLLAAYPEFLNANRYKISVTGDFQPEPLIKALKESFELLQPQGSISSPTVLIPDFPAKSKRINLKIRHFFYTDTKAEDAGPMPAVLVPTKEFLDPVQYWIHSPEPGTEEFTLFNALLLRIKDLPESKGLVRILLPSAEVNAAAITILDVKKTSAADETYRKLTESVKLQLSASENPDEGTSEAAAIKSSWIKYFLSATKDNKGTGLLISGGKKFDSYLNEYETLVHADKDAFLKTAEAYLPSEAPIRIYSSDSKK